MIYIAITWLVGVGFFVALGLLLLIKLIVIYPGFFALLGIAITIVAVIIVIKNWEVK